VKPDKPAMVMEYWLGWFDQWGRRHNVKDVKAVANTMEEILKFGASVNLYMFHGNDYQLEMNMYNQVNSEYPYSGAVIAMHVI